MAQIGIGVQRAAAAASLTAAVTVLACALSTSPAARADDPTGTPTLQPPTVAPTATATPTPPATSTPLPAPTSAVSVRRETRKHRKRVRKRPSSHRKAQHSATATPRPTSTPRPAHRRHKHLRHKTKPKPTPTATPPINLTAEDSIKPVTCNGKPRPTIGRPFLTPPYRGWTSIVSYFDHDLPDFAQDGLVVTATGLEAQPDGTHRASDFPAYWNRSLRQFVYYDGHNGYDYDLSYVPVEAAAPGKVIFAAYEYPDAPEHGYGQMVMIDHGNGYITLYGHFSKIMVKVGEKVRRGQQIGISGNTGHSSGPHLHFTVFHNCTPTDPYGWSGSGPDPLQNYQGESATYLWLRPPLVTNPAPAWPGIDQLPATTARRYLLLRLPPAADGPSSFIAALRREVAQVRSRLGIRAGVRADVFRGALVVEAPVSASQLYALPDVASIAAPDALDGVRDDVMAALARAALHARARPIHLDHSSTWSGYLVQWSGRAFLVGRGAKGKQIDLRLSRGRHTVALRRVAADPSSGAYAVDLGTMSGQSLAALRRELAGDSHAGASVSLQPVKRTPAEPARRSSSPLSPAALLVPALLLAGVLAAAWWRPWPRRRHS